MEGNKLNIFAEWWGKIFDHYLQFRDGVQSKIFDSLTKTEEKALIFVLETIGDEGILSISEAIRQSGISRPVFTGLLDKLDRYKAAEIKNMGVKGTYINFYDHILSKFEIS
jgi:GTP-sensing pleiotropic transcriptional regulator CodY